MEWGGPGGSRNNRWEPQRLPRVGREMQGLAGAPGRGGVPK